MTETRLRRQAFALLAVAVFVTLGALGRAVADAMHRTVDVETAVEVATTIAEAVDAVDGLLP